MTCSIPIITANAVSFGALLREAFPQRPAKHASLWADASPRTVEDWLQGRREPGWSRIVRLLHYPRFRAQIRALCDRIEMEEIAIAAEIQRRQAERADMALARKTMGTHRMPMGAEMVRLVGAAD